MNELTIDQLDFLKNHGIHLKFVFNAYGLSKSEYKSIMKDLNKLIAYNVSPCNSYGHTLRTRSGHCCQCNTAHLAFQKRNDSSGIVYIAGTLKGQLIKVGYSKSVEVRSKSLNTSCYAGFKDWEILYALQSEDAGRIETKANSLLHKYAFILDYEHDGHWQDSYETFSCAFSKAKQFVNEAFSSNSYKVTIIRDVKTNQYEFKNLIKL